MKKIIALVLVLACMFCLVGCKADKQGELENDNVTNDFNFIVIEASKEHLLVAEIGENGKAVEAKQYSVPNVFNSDKIAVGEKIIIQHSGVILETFPMQFGRIYSMERYDPETGLNVVVNID